MKFKELPKYLHTDTGRAYLVLATDVYGNWNAGYHQWIESDIEDIGQYIIVGDNINDAKTIDEAMERLLEEMNANA